MTRTTRPGHAGGSTRQKHPRVQHFRKSRRRPHPPPCSWASLLAAAPTAIIVLDARDRGGSSPAIAMFGSPAPSTPAAGGGLFGTPGAFPARPPRRPPPRRILPARRRGLHPARSDPTRAAPTAPFAPRVSRSPAPAAGGFGTPSFGAPAGGGFGTPRRPRPRAAGPFGAPAASTPGGFGAAPATPARRPRRSRGGGGLFGSAAPAPAAAGSSEPAPAAGGGGLSEEPPRRRRRRGRRRAFGSAAPATGGGGLFGSAAPAPASTPAGGGLFGSAAPATGGGGLFGSAAPAPASTPAGGGLFGSAAPATGGGGLFGSAAPATGGGGLFGGASAPATGGGLSAARRRRLRAAVCSGRPPRRRRDAFFGGAAAPGGGLFGPSSAVAGGGALQPLGGGVLNGASGPLGVAQPAPSFLTTADGHPVKHFTQWNELAPAAQQNLEALEKKIVAAREESTLLEDVARLRGESRGRAEVPSGGEALRRELERRARRVGRVAPGRDAAVER